MSNAAGNIIEFRAPIPEAVYPTSYQNPPQPDSTGYITPLSATPSETTAQQPNSFARKLIDAYFEPKPFESEELYERLGVKTFRKYMPTTGDLVMKHVWHSSALPEGDTHKETLDNLNRMNRVNEAIHLGIFAVYAGTSAEMLHEGKPVMAAIFAASNTLVNTYPIMLQRYTRLRTNRIASRLNSGNRLRS